MDGFVCVVSLLLLSLACWNCCSLFSLVCVLTIHLARAVQRRRGDTGPLTPDHMREAYRMYQQETGRVGAARPLKGKKVFVR